MGNAARVKADATYVDLLNLPEHLIGEIIDGELYTQPRPSPRHAWATSRIRWFLILFAGWRKENLPQLPETAWIDVVPDWVCEITTRINGKCPPLVCSNYGCSLCRCHDLYVANLFQHQQVGIPGYQAVRFAR